MAPSAITQPGVVDATVPATKNADNDIQALKDDHHGREALAAICYGGSLPAIPSHPSFAPHRAWLLTHMTSVFRHWSREGYIEGMSGHISVRDPEYPHCFWMNPLGIHFGLLKASDMLLLSDDPDPNKVEMIIAGGGRGQRKVANKAGWAIHGAIHRARPDVNAACHAHTRAGKAWSATGRRLEMVDQDVCNFYGEALALYNDYGGVVIGSALGEGDAIAKALGPRGKGAVLRNHGLLTVGQTVDEAGFLFGLLERSCAIQLDLLKVGGEKVLIDEKEAEFNFRMASAPSTLYWEFQPYYDYEKAMSRDDFGDVEEKDLVIFLQ
jgi:ribulose-5-phosphate 4-epimerase/fuculose-1-phosphate aldolase